MNHPITFNSCIFPHSISAQITSLCNSPVSDLTHKAKEFIDESLNSFSSLQHSELNKVQGVFGCSLITASAFLLSKFSRNPSVLSEGIKALSNLARSPSGLILGLSVLFLLEGCRRRSNSASSTERNSSSTIPPVASQPRFVEKSRLDWRGSAHGDSVTFIRMLHADLLRRDTEAEKNVLGLYQWRVLNYLAQHRTRHIFMEDLTERRDPEWLRRNLRERGAGPGLAHISGSDFENGFSLPLATSPNHLQIDILSLMTATYPYLLLNSSAILHPTVTPTEWEAVQEAYLSSREENIPIREEWEIRELSQLAAANIREGVVLLNGTRHSFCDAYRHFNFAPQVNSVWWEVSNSSTPGLERESRMLPPACVP